MEAETRQRKRRVVMVALAACLVVAGIGGTLAWFSAQSQLDNVFTVGKITDPDPETPKPDDPYTPDPIKPDDPDRDKKVNGNLYEPNWDPNSKIGPGAQVAKDPWVGIGKNSEPAYVYVYVKNDIEDSGDNHAYFKIEEGWAPVNTTMIPNSANFVEGLFVYVGDNGLKPELLVPAGDPKEDAWTKTPLFTHVSTSSSFKLADNIVDDKAGDIKVYAYVAAASNEGEMKDLDVLKNAAIKWANDIKNQPAQP